MNFIFSDSRPFTSRRKKHCILQTFHQMHLTGVPYIIIWMLSVSDFPRVLTTRTAITPVTRPCVWGTIDFYVFFAFCLFFTLHVKVKCKSSKMFQFLNIKWIWTLMKTELFHFSMNSSIFVFVRGTDKILPYCWNRKFNFDTCKWFWRNRFIKVCLKLNTDLVKHY